MQLGTLERFYLTGPWREWQRRYELAQFRQLTSLPTGGAVLELGCGDGRGLAALHHALQPKHLTGLDVDPRMLHHAQHTLTRTHTPATLINASADSLPQNKASLNTIVSFGCIHHVPDWQQAMAEISRTLQVGGLLLAEEFYAPLLEAPVFKQLVPHPPQRFTHNDFLTACTSHGLAVQAHKNILGLAGFVVAKKV